jgi:D-xylose 1-dehydrogenase
MTKAGAIYPSLEGRTAFVSGGGSGIGAAIVENFARQKAKVAFVDVDENASVALKTRLGIAGATIHFERCDVRDMPALQKAIANARAALGPITLLVNNAARDDRHVTEEVTPDYWDERMAVNLKHHFFAAQAVLSDMKAAAGGSIVNLGSSSWMTGEGGMAVYTAAKSGVIGLTRSLARDFGRFNIRVNAIAPGWILTERQRQLWLTPEKHARLMEQQCLKRDLDGNDIARMVMFLCSDDASAITSQHYVVDGGRL